MSIRNENKAMVSPPDQQHFGACFCSSSLPWFLPLLILFSVIFLGTVDFFSIYSSNEIFPDCQPYLLFATKILINILWALSDIIFLFKSYFFLSLHSNVSILYHNFFQEDTELFYISG